LVIHREAIKILPFMSRGGAPVPQRFLKLEHH